jgi:hypothetical protein
MSNSALLNHATIVSWVQRRGELPPTFEGDEHPSPLFFGFGPIAPGRVEIGWDRFFEQFERADLAFAYRDVAPNDELDGSHEFVKRATLPELTIAGRKTVVERGHESWP